MFRDKSHRGTVLFVNKLKIRRKISRTYCIFRNCVIYCLSDRRLCPLLVTKKDAPYGKPLLSVRDLSFFRQKTKLSGWWENADGHQHFLNAAVFPLCPAICICSKRLHLPRQRFRRRLCTPCNVTSFSAKESTAGKL